MVGGERERRWTGRSCSGCWPAGRQLAEPARLRRRRRCGRGRRGCDRGGLGDEVFGLGERTQAEFAVLTAWAPSRRPWTGRSPARPRRRLRPPTRGLGLLGIGVGLDRADRRCVRRRRRGAVQIAVARGATVVATASEGNQDYLREIGAIPVLYGDGLADRVAGTGAGPLDGVFDVAGKTPIERADRAGGRAGPGGHHRQLRRPPRPASGSPPVARATRPPRWPRPPGCWRTASWSTQGADVPAGPGGRGLSGESGPHPRQDRAAALRSAR